MKLSFDTTSVRLDRSTFLHVVDEPGTVLSCLQGCLWITRDGSPVDIELLEGQAYLVPDGVRVLVCAFAPSTVHVQRLQRDDPPRVTWPNVSSVLARPAAAWRRAWASPVAIIC